MNLMKARVILAASVAAGGLTMMAGCAVDQNGHMALVLPTVVVAAPPPVVVAPAPVYAAPVVEAPAVVVEEPVLVPEVYVEVDGVNFAMVGDQYVYLGDGGVWMVCEPWRLEHFHAWERDHHDWRDHAIHNDRFRRDAHGHSVDRDGHVTDRNGHAVDRSGHSVGPGGHAAGPAGHPATGGKPLPKAAPAKKSEEKK
jgi:hypothetical protein